MEEWIKYAENDPELKKDANGSAGSCLWEGYPEDKSFGTPWFEFYQGFISTKKPDIHVIRKMIVIAEALNAKIYDEDGEPFDPGFLGL